MTKSFQLADVFRLAQTVPAWAHVTRRGSAAGEILYIYFFDAVVWV